jgi:hypothetical protein
MLSSLQCIIWFVLALLAEIPVVVSLFSPLDDIKLTISQVFLVLDLNGMSFFSRSPYVDGA